MPKFILTGTLTLTGVVFEVEANDADTARRLVREGRWDDRCDDEADIKSVTVSRLRLA
jgi:hypothetical protein